MPIYGVQSSKFLAGFVHSVSLKSSFCCLPAARWRSRNRYLTAKPAIIRRQLQGVFSSWLRPSLHCWCAHKSDNKAISGVPTYITNGMALTALALLQHKKVRPSYAPQPYHTRALAYLADKLGAGHSARLNAGHSYASFYIVSNTAPSSLEQKSASPRVPQTEALGTETTSTVETWRQLWHTAHSFIDECAAQVTEAAGWISPADGEIGRTAQ